MRTSSTLANARLANERSKARATRDAALLLEDTAHVFGREWFTPEQWRNAFQHGREDKPHGLIRTLKRALARLKLPPMEKVDSRHFYDLRPLPGDSPRYRLPPLETVREATHAVLGSPLSDADY